MRIMHKEGRRKEMLVSFVVRCFVVKIKLDLRSDLIRVAKGQSATDRPGGSARRRYCSEVKKKKKKKKN
jgi:hypothetical protein